jgi:hypothetical protein
MSPLALGAAGRRHKAYMGYLSTVLGDRSGFSERVGADGEGFHFCFANSTPCVTFYRRGSVDI